MERGKYVSRSVYQKQVEENRRLLADIYVLVMSKGVSPERIIVKDKWERKFTAERELREVLSEYAVQYVKDNPDSVVSQLVREFPPKK